MASEMEGMWGLLDSDCPVLALVLEDTVVPVTDGVEEVLPVLWSRESPMTMGGTECVEASNHPAWKSPSIKVWPQTVPWLLLPTKAPPWWMGRVWATRGCQRGYYHVSLLRL